jgi:solute carrier family 6 GABA transporter-like protein 6/8/11/12/13
VTLPYILCIFLFFRVLALPGSSSGFSKLFTYDWEKFLTVKAWSDAGNAAFLVFITGGGINQSLASFRPVRSKFFLLSALLPVITICTHFLMAAIVFGFLGYYTEHTGIAFEDLAISGPDLLFVTYPQILQTIPLSNFWCIIFFLTVLLLGIDSQFAMIDVMIYYVKDLKFKFNGQYMSSHSITAGVCTLMCIAS